MQWYLVCCVCVVWFMWNKQSWPDSKIICKARWLWYCSALWLLQVPWRYWVKNVVQVRRNASRASQGIASIYLPLLNSAQLTAKRLWFALWQGYSIGWHRNECVEVTNRPLMRESPDFKEKELFLAAAFRRRWHPENVKGFRELIGPKREAYSASSCLTAAIKLEGLKRRR